MEKDKCPQTNWYCVQETNVALLNQIYEFMQKDIAEIKDTLKVFVEKAEDKYALKSDCENLKKIVYAILW